MSDVSDVSELYGDYSIMVRKKVILGDKEFPSKTKAAKYVRKLMEGYTDGHHFIGER